MKRSKLIFLLFLYCAICNLLAQSPDSLFTDKHINDICITDPQRVLALLDEAEEKELLPIHRINYLRSLTYNNGLGQYRIAFDYAEKAYQSDSTRNNPEFALRLLDIMANQCLSIGLYPECIWYANEGARIARSVNNKGQEANMILYIGYAKREIGLKADAEKELRRVIDLHERCINPDSGWEEYDNLLYSYGTLITFYEEDGEFEKAIHLLPRYEAAINEMARYPNLPEGIVDLRHSSQYAAFACIFAKNGDQEKARHYYLKYLNTQYASTPEGQSIRIQYLLDTKRYAEALTYIHAEKQRLTDNKETISYNYLHYALKYETEAYTGLGNYKAAANSYRQMLAITDSLNRDERQNIALELATIYKTNEKNEQIHQQKTKLERFRTLLFVSAGTIALSAIIIWLIIIFLRVTRRKNQVLVKQINELQYYRDEIMRLKKENRATTLPVEEELSPERLLFKEMDTLIDEEQLFLDPNFTRDQLIKRIGIPKNSFSNLLQTFAGTNFNGYINRKRLEYSIPLLRDVKNYTIESVALESGFNNSRTYHRAFRDKYSITPAEYRQKA